MIKPPHFPIKPPAKPLTALASSPAKPNHQEFRRDILQAKVVEARQKAPLAPPVYQPTSRANTAQRGVSKTQQMAISTKPRPDAPAVYRPQPVPRVLQAKIGAGQQPGVLRPRHPAAPTAYRPQPLSRILNNSPQPAPRERSSANLPTRKPQNENQTRFSFVAQRQTPQRERVHAGSARSVVNRVEESRLPTTRLQRTRAASVDSVGPRPQTRKVDPAIQLNNSSASQVRRHCQTDGAVIQPLLMTSNQFRTSMGRNFTTNFEWTLDRKNKQTALLRFIEQKIDIYNRQAQKDVQRIARRKQPYRLDERQRLLNEIQRSLYRWISQNPSSNRKDAALGLLDDVQREHRQTIEDGLGARRGLKLFANGITEQREQRQLDEMWESIVSGNGKIRIKEVDPLTASIIEIRIPGFRSEVLAAFARLLALPRGRHIIRKILNQPKTVTIVPLNPLSNLLLKEPGGYSMPLSDDDSHTVNISDQGNKLKKVVGGRRNKPLGSDVQIGMLPGLTDSKIWMGGMLPPDDQNFHELHTPVFLILAHELLHAKHQIRGRDRANVEGNFDGEISFSNAEELRVIHSGNTSENKFRQDLDLGMRIGHNFSGERA